MLRTELEFAKERAAIMIRKGHLSFNEIAKLVGLGNGTVRKIAKRDGLSRPQPWQLNPPTSEPLGRGYSSAPPIARGT
jgi:hypothetical protein